jgi:DMSO/TMAO reductase YedYZ molybdopterin-dependent catalytic subunit
MREPREGALTAAMQLAAGELVAALLPGARGPLIGAVQRLIHMTPGPALDVGVATAQSADKILLKTGVAAGSMAAGATLGERGLAGGGVATAAAAASCEDAAIGPTLLASAAGQVAGRLGGRRARLVALTAVAALAVDRAQLRRLDSKRKARPVSGRPTAAAELPVPGISPLYTPNATFYETDVTARPPRVDPDDWRLRVNGMVERPLELSLDELEALGLEELDATLVCVHNPVGGDRIGSARWVGVPLARLLEAAGAKQGAEQLLARSVDGFTAGVPVERIASGGPALLAIGMNGEPLPVEHGYPARLLVPGLWGADANTKWVSELEVTSWEAVRDYWDRRGWPRQPSFVQPAARIDVPLNRAIVEPGEVTVAGVAWAPPEGVEGVEVQVDGGPWEAADLGAELAPTMWRQWRLTWNAEPGEHELHVRAIGRRRVQPDADEPPYPVGSRGYDAHRVTVAAGAQRRRRVGRAAADDAWARLRLAARGLAAWHQRGFPPTPRFPAPPPASGK